jgi:hypothetical protein
MKSKKSQQSIGMSFGMIFSIILIIFFLLTAFFAIRAFLNSRDCTQVGMFLKDFDSEVTNTWDSQGVSTEFKRSLPSKIDYVCFADLSEPQKGDFKDVYEEMSIYTVHDADLFFYPKGSSCKIPYKKIKHLDMPEITKTDNPYCIPVEKGTIRIRVEKEFNERLVRVS